MRRASSALTQEMIDKFRAYLSTAQSIETVADICGIHRATVYRWIKRGERELTRVARIASDEADAQPNAKEAIFLDFLLACRECMARRELSFLKIIQDAAMGEKPETDASAKGKKRTRGTWQAAAWLLERWKPDVYGSDKHALHMLQGRVRELERQVEAQS